jgi:hypothetical protein
MTPKDFVLPVLTAIIGFIVAYMTTLLKFRKGLEAKYDESLRAQRIETYKRLWKLLQPLARYAREEEATPARMEQLGGELRGWYFEDGGLFCTNETRNAYFKLQQGIEQAVKAVEGKDAQTNFEDKVEQQLRQLGSNLRTSMARDVGTRLRSPLAGDDDSAA